MPIDHVAIVVSDINSSVDWYTKNFNASIDYQDEAWAMLKIGKDKLALTLEGVHPPHIAILINSIENFPSGSEIKTHRDGSKYTYIKDLDNNVIEYIHYEND